MAVDLQQVKIYRDPDAVIKKNLSETVLSSGTHFPNMLMNERTNRYALIGSKESFIWSELEGSSSMLELEMAFWERYGLRAPIYIRKVIDRWAKNGYVNYDQVDSPNKSPLRFFGFLSFSWEINRFDSIATRLYQLIGAKVTNEYIINLLLLISGIGGLNYLLTLLQTPQILYWDRTVISNILVLLPVSLGCTFIHELFHLFYAKKYSVAVNRAGLKFLWGIPVFFVDTSEIWIKPRKQRLEVSIAGIMANFIMFGLSSLFLQLSAGSSPIVHAFVYQLVWFNLFSILINSIPFVEFDGYYVLLDLLQVTNLKRNALNMLFSPGTYRDRPLPMLAFAVMSVLTSAGLLMFGAYSWYKVVEPLVG